MVTEDPQVSIPTCDQSRRTLKCGDSLRGAKGTNAAVKDFWMACRGREFAYAS